MSPSMSSCANSSRRTRSAFSSTRSSSSFSCSSSICWPAGLLSFLRSPSSRRSLSAWWPSTGSAKRMATAMNEASQRQALLVESISTLETIKALQAESYLLRRWREHSKNAAKTSEQIKQLSAVGRQPDAVHPATGDGRAGRGWRLHLCGRRHHDRRNHSGGHAVGAGRRTAWADCRSPCRGFGRRCCR